ncbi:kinase-like protein [Rhizophagus irregularis]|uniref:Kinase-like protein n=1 Tax=Rhizophagus irregularis TaxID=588596 RepID=A0A2I1HDG1_9GLOM|nr:kinase-like protein [Rhizophagus irregularis]
MISGYKHYQQVHFQQIIQYAKDVANRWIIFGVLYVKLKYLKKIYELIRNSQLNAKKHDNYFEWVEYDRFEDVKYLIQGSYCKIYKATWRDGIREKWIMNLDKIKNVICCYGFTLNPETNRYYMILKYANYGNFRQYIWKKFPFRWCKRLSILQKIVKSLSNIHEANYIHQQQQYGNLPYIAPEVIRGNGNLTSIKSDIYSIGIIMWELASGE